MSRGRPRPSPGKRQRHLLGAVLLGATLSACATLPRGEPIPVNTSTLLDDYVLAHGFAAGRVLSENVDRATIAEIIHLDHDALLAISLSVANPGSADAKTRATAALARLTGFVSEQGEGGTVGPGQRQGAR